MRFIAIFLIVLFSSPALAHHRHHHHHRVVHAHSFQEGLGHGLAHMLKSIERVNTDAGPVLVSSRLADRFKGLVNDFVAAGYRPRHIGCYARGGHVRHSRHYLGEACDFDQTGWGKTNKFMYSHQAAAIIRKWGFTNGCSFRDCGHVGTDGQYGNRYKIARRGREKVGHLRSRNRPDNG